MSLVFLPSQSKTIFVGREEHLGVFQSILRGERPEWILHISGDGGIGKTRLLEQYEDAATSEFGGRLDRKSVV